MKNRLIPLDIAKGVAIILIVWAHADAKMDSVFYESSLRFIHQVIYSFHIPLFFIVAGVLAKISLDKLGFRLLGYTKQLVTRLLIPFYSLSLVFFFINILVPRSFTHSPSIMEMALGLAIMQSHPDYLPSGVLWFLFVLFICAFFHALIIKKTKINLYVWLTISLLITLSCGLFWNTYILGLDRITRNLFFYVFGYCVSDQIVVGNIKRNTTFILVMIAIWVAGFYFFYNGYYAFRTVTGVSGALCILSMAFVNLPKRLQWFTDRLKFLGEHSIIIFVLHMPISLLIFKGLQVVHLLNSFLGFGISVFSGILFPLIIGVIISRVPLLYRCLFGKLPNDRNILCKSPMAPF
jgi:fucose 4-O-acetylase-like acetyltransferase